MEQQDFLIAIANLSIALIALIAFTNIVVALRQIGGGNLNDFQVLVVRLFSVCGFCAMFFAILPILLIYFGVPERLLWRICNFPLAVSIVLVHFWYFRNRRRVAPLRPFLIANYITTALLIAAVFLLILGTLGLYQGDSIAPFAFTLVGLLIASAAAFLNTLSDFLILPN